MIKLEELNKLKSKVKNYTYKIELFDQYALNNYISLQGNIINNEVDTFDLEKKVFDEFLINASNSVLLLLGESGSGKTLFGQNIFEKISDTTDASHIYRVALWIPLLSITNLSNLLEEHCYQNLGLSPEEFNLLTSGEIDLVIILDDYNSINTNRNLYLDNNLDKLPAKVIITCLNEFVLKIPDYQKLFCPPTESSKKLIEFYTSPFQSNQIEAYVKQYVATYKSSKWEAQDYLKQIKIIPELNELIGNPFILSIVIKELPTIVESYKDEAKVSKRIKLTRYDLYKIFTQEYFLRQKEKIEQEKTISLEFISKYGHSSLEEVMQDFSCNLALAMFQRRISAVSYMPSKHIKSLLSFSSKKQESTSWEEQFFDDEKNPDLKLIRSGCPLRIIRRNLYTFLHPSLISFFAAQHLFNGALIESWIIADTNLNAAVIEDFEILKLLADKVLRDEEFETVLFQVIETSKYEPSVTIAAANAITILNLAKVSFNKRDFKRVRIGGIFKHINKIENTENWGLDIHGGLWYEKDRLNAEPDKHEFIFYGANLTGGIFQETDMSQADVRFSNLSFTTLNNANLNNSCLEGITFSELPSLEGELGCYSPNGKLVALIKGKDFRKKIMIYDAETFSLVKQIYTSYFDEIPTCLCFSLDSTYVLLAGNDSKAYLFEIKTEKLIKEFVGHHDTIRSIAFRKPFGKQFASASSDKTIRIWDIEEGTLANILSEHTAAIFSLDYHPQGEQLASGDEGGTIILWSTNTGTVLRKMIGHEGAVFSLHFHPKEDRLVSGGGGGVICLWQFTTGYLIKRINAEAGRNIMMPDDFKKMAGANWYEFNLRQLGFSDSNYKAAMKLIKNGITVFSVQFSPNGKEIISGGMDRIIYKWDSENGNLIGALAGHLGGVYKVYYQPPDGKRLISCSSNRLHDHTIRFWDTSESNSLVSGLSPHEGAIICVTFRSDGKQLASAGYDKTVRLWDQRNGKLTRSFKAHSSAIFQIQYHNDNKKIASLSFDKTICLWETETGSLISSFQVEFNLTGAIKFLPDQESLVFANDQGALFLLNITNGQKDMIHSFNTNDKEIFKIVFNTSGSLVAFGTENGILTIWETSTGQLVKRITGISGTIITIDFHPEGRIIACGGSENYIFLWDIMTGKSLGILSVNYPSPLYTIKFSPDGKKLIASCYKLKNLSTPFQSQILLMWDMYSRQQVLLSCFSVGSIYALDCIYIPNLTYYPFLFCLSTGDEYGKVKVWDIEKTSKGIEILLRWKNGYPTLSSVKLNLNQSTGLSAINHQLLQERSKQNTESTIIGNPRLDRKTQEILSSKKLLEQRNAQVFIPTGKVFINYQLLNKKYEVTRDEWLISLVRKKSDHLKESSRSLETGGHVWLIVQGIDQDSYSLIKECHLFLDEMKPSYFGKRIGTGLIRINDKSFWDLDYEAKHLLLAESWCVKREVAEQLFINIETEQNKDLGYILTGRSLTFFGKKYSCLTWCLEHLQKLGLTFEQVDPNRIKWYDFAVAYPTNYLPSTDTEQKANSCRLV